MTNMNKNQWKTDYSKLIRISKRNLNKLRLIRDNLSMAEKLDEILNLYFINAGGDKEIKRIQQEIDTLKQ